MPEMCTFVANIQNQFLQCFGNQFGEPQYQRSRLRHFVALNIFCPLGMQTYQVCRRIRLVVACCRCIKKSRGQRRVLVRWTFFTSFLKQCVTKFSLYFINFRLFQLRNTYKQKFKRKWKFCFQTFSKKGKNLKGLAELQYSTVRKGKGWYRIDNKNLLGLGVNKLTPPPPPQVPGGTPCHRNSYYQYSTVQYNLL